MSQPDALERIYRLYRAPMLRLAARILGNADYAEDAVHDAFESVARNLGRLDAPEDPRTRGYVMVVTERKAIDLLRARRRDAAETLDEETAGACGADEDGHDLRACMARLPARYREILLLRYVYGYSMRETAELMDVPYTTVGKLTQRAKERLYALCRAEGILP